MKVNIDGVNINYVFKGKGKPIILIHGHGENIYTWRHNIDKLAENFKVYALDLKGFGESDKPIDSDYSISSMSELVINFMDRLDIDQAVIVCHSFGGKIGIQSIVDHPNRFVGLGLLGSAVTKFKMDPNYRLISDEKKGRFLLNLFNRDVIKQTIKSIHDKSYKITDEDIDNEIKIGDSEGAKHAFQQYLIEFLKNEEAFIEKLDKISVPTLIIWGKNDKFISSEHGKLIEERIKDSKLVILENCGHNSHEDQDEIVNQLIIENFGNFS